MPELPEVEVISRGLRPLLIHRKIQSIWYSGKNLRNPVDLAILCAETTEAVIMDVRRRAKYIQLHLNTGGIIVIHLGMTGNLGVFQSPSPRIKHDHLEWVLADNTILRYNDSRRFGSIQYLAPEDSLQIEHIFYKNTGPEPFSEEFCAKYLYETAQKTSISVKQFLMTNKVVAGVGNIYANESLFRAKIKPWRKARAISKKQWNKLVVDVREVLTEAIECGGSTISDYLNASQERGYFQMNFSVYGRKGLPCIVCGSLIEKKVLGGRASFFCRCCQK